MPKQPVAVTLNDEESVDAVVMFADRQTIQSARVLKDSGEMIAPVTIARTGVMLYAAKELGPQFSDLPPEQIVRVDTPAEVLFDEAVIEMCRSMPVTIGHPKNDVNLTNNKELQKGFLEGTPLADGSHLGGFVVLNDTSAIKLVDSGVDQTSWGHDAILRRDVSPEGVVSATKTKITAVNHLAIVRRGRAQSTRIGDSGEEIAIVDKSQFDTVEAERDAAISKVATLEQKLADAETAKLTDEAIQNMVEQRVLARTELMVSVARLGDEYSKLDFAGKSEDEVKRAVVAKLLDADVSARSVEYINARFEIALEDSAEFTASDALAASLRDSFNKEETVPQPSVAEKALEARRARYESL